jgi:hypothetical protein
VQAENCRLTVHRALAPKRERCAVLARKMKVFVQSEEQRRVEPDMMYQVEKAREK